MLSLLILLLHAAAFISTMLTLCGKRVSYRNPLNTVTVSSYCNNQNFNSPTAIVIDVITVANVVPLQKPEAEAIPVAPDLPVKTALPKTAVRLLIYRNLEILYPELP